MSITITKESFVTWLSSKKPDAVVGYLGQKYSNPVYNWASEQVANYAKELKAWSWDVNVGIRPSGWCVAYSYTLPHEFLPGPGKYSGQMLIEIPLEFHMDFFGIPERGHVTPPITAKDALDHLQEVAVYY